jgi:FkbM family methyltransferase
MNKYPPSNSIANNQGIPGFFHSIKRSFDHFLRTKKFVRCINTNTGYLYLEKNIIVIPPIRYTPSELEDLTHDYFLWNFKPGLGDCIFDIGAGMGTEVPTYCGLVGNKGKIYCFEPHRKSASIARRLIAINGFSNVEVHELGLSNQDGELLISDDPDSLGINSTVREDLLAGPVLKTKSTTLDAFIKLHNINKINFLKMNIEGAEVSALEGASEALKITENVAISCHDFISDFEGGGDEMRTKEKIRMILKDAGFTIHERTNDERPVIRDMLYGNKAVSVRSVPIS